MSFSTGLRASMLTISLLLLARPSAFAEETQPAVQEDSGGVLVSYTAPMRKVVLTRDFRLTDTEELAEYANPVSDAPSKVVTVTKSTQVAAEAAAELLRSLRETDLYYALKDSYGAGAEERSYPYTILVRDGGQEKQVICRTSPEAAAKPKAFAAAEGRIIEFARKAVEINEGEEAR
jgi:hypothetical protein